MPTVKEETDKVGEQTKQGASTQQVKAINMADEELKRRAWMGL
jgi:hypothetical protein